jgi:hypothetical protein
MKTTKHFCPICKNVIMSTESNFKQHYRQCNKESEKKDSDNPIACEICNKKLPNLKSYMVHKLFHDSRNLIGASENASSKVYSKAPVICEVSRGMKSTTFHENNVSSSQQLCGKEFTNSQGLRTHKKNVHR